MIEGFEKHTKDLNEADEKLAVTVFDVLKANYSQFYRSSDLRRIVGVRHGAIISEPKMRKLIHYARTDLCSTGTIVASSKGYRYSEDIDKIEKYQRGLNQRINSQLEIYNEVVSLLKRKKSKKRATSREITARKKESYTQTEFNFKEGE